MRAPPPLILLLRIAKPGLSLHVKENHCFFKKICLNSLKNHGRIPTTPLEVGTYHRSNCVSEIHRDAMQEDMIQMTLIIHRSAGYK